MKLLAVSVAALAIFATGSGVASASTIEPARNPYSTRLLRAVDTCKTRVTPTTTFQQLMSCNSNLAAPQPNNTAEIDIWWLVRDCLWLGWTPGRGDGGFDNDVVNDCLDRGGVL